MSMRVGTPVNQKRLTNVSIVRLNKMGKRFEIACYNNKVLSWRSQVEADLGEVLQSDFIFVNVGKGEFAKAKDLKAAFGTEDAEAVAKVILRDGEIQVTGKERGAHTDALSKDIATIISEKCINPTNSRPYTVSTILSAMKNDIKYSINPTRGAKQQALEVIRRLQAVIPLVRARMHVRVHFSTAEKRPPLDSEEPSAPSAVLAQLLAFPGAERLRKGDAGGGGMAGATAPAEEDLYIEPDSFKAVSALVQGAGGSVEVVQLSVLAEGGISQQAGGKREGGGKGGEDGGTHRAHQEAGERGRRGGSKEGDAAVAREATVPPHTEHGEEEGRGGDGAEAPGSSRDHAAKAKGRKSKGAKRREKEEAVERAAAKEQAAARAEARAAAAIRRTREGAGVARAAGAAGVAGAAADGPREGAGGDPAAAPPPGGGLGVDAPSPHPPPPPSSATPPPSADAAKRCTTCGGSFASAGEHRAHFKSDWHRFNLKLKLAGQPVVSEAEFAVDAGDFF